LNSKPDLGRKFILIALDAEGERFDPFDPHSVNIGLLSDP
jgi:hypothetical protein